MIGHKNHGKSTLLTRLIFELGQLPKADQKWALEMCDAGKDRQVPWNNFPKYGTIIPAQISAQKEMPGSPVSKKAQFSFEMAFRTVNIGNQIYLFRDLPGQRRFLKNLIVASSGINLAILVVSCVAKEFNEGVSKRGLIRTHLELVRVLGVQKIVVAVSKIDEEGKETISFQEAVKQLKTHILDWGLDLDRQEKVELSFLPVSGILGLNVIEPISVGEYPTLREVLEKTPLPQRKESRTLRIQMNRITRFPIGKVAYGRIISGTVSIGQILSTSPIKTKLKVRGIQRLVHSWSPRKRYHDSVDSAGPGEEVSLLLLGDDNDFDQLCALPHEGRGCLFGPENDPPQSTRWFSAYLLVTSGSAERFKRRKELPKAHPNQREGLCSKEEGESNKESGKPKFLPLCFVHSAQFAIRVYFYRPLSMTEKGLSPSKREDVDSKGGISDNGAYEIHLPLNKIRNNRAYDVLIEVEPNRQQLPGVAIDTYKRNPELGRFILFDRYMVVGAGIVNSLNPAFKL